MAEHADTVASVREWVDRLRISLPLSVDVAALGVMSKAPYQLLCTREALIWRTEELARNACDALERNDFAAAEILTRAVTENAAMTWKLMNILDGRSAYTPQQLNDLLMRLLGGSKWPEAPKPVHINDLLREIEKEIPGVMASYDGMSETAHPNWSGVVGMYSKTDQENFVTYFGRGLHGADGKQKAISSAMLGSLGAFEHAYNRISDLMPAFIAELEAI
ncbi:MAG: hypothetical protein P4M05_33620 [Bradyrhizobium sp.]|nr:hypothetical protein [Bradyrhizobium sp.]